MSAQADLKKIREIVENTDEHRNRARRESWDAIKAVLADEKPEKDEKDEEAPASPEEIEELEEVGFKVEEAPPVRRGPGRPPKSA